MDMIEGVSAVYDSGRQGHSCWPHRLIKRIGSSRAGAWLFSHTIHHLDRPILRLSNGQQSLTGLLSGLPVVTLTAIGAKSGQPRTVPLVAIPNDDTIILIASSFGRARHPAWYHNLKANPEVTLSIEGRVRIYIALEANGAERKRYWQRAIAFYAGFETYQQRAGDRIIPVMVLTPQEMA